VKFTNLTPNVIFLENTFINVETVYDYDTNGLSLIIEYFHGDKDLFQFGSKQELDRALIKIQTAMKSLDYGV
jgi:hypothetical protein